MSFTAKDLHACAVRELAMRRGVYPKFFASGRMTKEQLDREIGMMEAIVSHLASLQRLPDEVADAVVAREGDWLKNVIAEEVAIRLPPLDPPPAQGSLI